MKSLNAFAFFATVAMVIQSPNVMAAKLPKGAPGTIIIGTNVKTGERVMVQLPGMLKKGESLERLKFEKIAQAGEKTGLSYKADDELNVGSSVSSNIYFRGGVGIGVAGYTRPIYGFGGGGYSYGRPWTGGGYYPSYGNYSYYPYGYWQNGDWSYAACGYPGYYGYNSYPYGGYDQYGYSQTSYYSSTEINRVSYDYNGAGYGGGYGGGYDGYGGGYGGPVATPY